MSFSYFLAKGSTLSFAQMLELLALEAGRSSEKDIAEGVTSSESAGVLLDIALDRSRQFLAVRKVVSNGDRLATLELFHLVPEDGVPRAGLLLPDAEDTSPQSDSALVNVLLAVSAHVESTRVPRFYELAGILLSTGSVQLQSLSQQDEIASLKSDVMHQTTVLDDTGQELRRLRERYHAVMTLPSATARIIVGAVEEDPFTSLEQLPKWAADHQDTIVVLPRALASAKKSLYFRPELVCKGLELLAGAYRNSRLGEASTEELQRALDEHGFKLDFSIGPTIAGSHGDAYFVKWEGRRELLGLHLSKGGGRDERFCLRIYFFWDTDTARVIVGELPAHLPNSLS